MRYPLIILFTLLSITGFSQRIQPGSSAQILQDLEKLNFLGTVLYVAAHPDDENTAMIAYFANGVHAHTAYLSMTRGDGGQNLIGPEIREGLGIIRTQELLAARRIDGGEQFFTRANDFGYSKTADETLKIWNEEEVLSDAVKVFRRFRPDVVITRFPPDARAGHGHHTTSAIIAQKAFDIAGDPSVYPDQAEKYGTWQPMRIFTNTGRWWNPNMTGDEPGVVTLDVGQYDPLLGETYTELAAKSRSQHKSQGFGATGRRGEIREYLEFVKGETVGKDVFDGIDTSWSRVKGGEEIGGMVSKVIEEFDPMNPSLSLPAMIDIRKKVSSVDSHWKEKKLPLVDQIIASMMGLYLEARSNEPEVVAGGNVRIALEIIQQTDLDIRLLKATSAMADYQPDVLIQGDMVIDSLLTIPSDAGESQPYWLRKTNGIGMYLVPDESFINLPENPSLLPWNVTLQVLGEEITYEIATQYRWNDPVKGEQHKPLVITPEVLVSIDEPVYLFSDNAPRTISGTVKSASGNITGEVKLNLPASWTVKPAKHVFEIKATGDVREFTFEVSPPENQEVAELVVEATTESGVYNQNLQHIAYDHIPDQVLFTKASARMVRVQLKKYGERVGYVPGAGDLIPATLREIGYQVYELTENDYNPEFLQTLDAIILGIRALNTDPEISYKMPKLLAYVENGGTLILQYNTSHRLQTNEFAPYPLQLSRERVSEENAAVSIIAPDHPVVNTPNKITEADFEGWVQERGLYFPNQWDEAFTPVLASNDSGEPSREGGLLVASYGKGYYVYSGYSWFRELPAGVPGAIRLFTNLVSLGNENSSEAYGHSE